MIRYRDLPRPGCSPFKSDNHDEHTVLRQLLAVADNDISYIAYPEAVYKDSAGLHLAIDLAAAVRKFETVPLSPIRIFCFGTPKLSANSA